MLLALRNLRLSFALLVAAATSAAEWSYSQKGPDWLGKIENYAVGSDSGGLGGLLVIRCVGNDTLELALLEPSTGSQIGAAAKLLGVTTRMFVRVDNSPVQSFDNATVEVWNRNAIGVVIEGRTPVDRCSASRASHQPDDIAAGTTDSGTSSALVLACASTFPPLRGGFTTCAGQPSLSVCWKLLEPGLRSPGICCSQQARKLTEPTDTASGAATERPGLAEAITAGKGYPRRLAVGQARQIPAASHREDQRAGY
jgi:hypothetical protein